MPVIAANFPSFPTTITIAPNICAGSLSYDGTTTASDGKFVIDLSKYNSKFTREKILNDKYTSVDGDSVELYSKKLILLLYIIKLDLIILIFIIKLKINNGQMHLESKWKLR